MFQHDSSDLLSLESEQFQTGLPRHVAKTYLWMFLGLAITFTVGMALYASGLVYVVFAIPMLSIALLIGQLILVVSLSSRIQKMSVNGCRAIFVAYSALTGVTIGAVLATYGASIAMLAFAVGSIFFGSMAVAGLITKRDVSGFGSLVVFGLIALLVMQVVNMFLGLDSFDTILCLIGVALFLGITTYDAKKTKDMYYAFEGNQDMLDKVSIYSALNLYLDFINIFLYLVRLMGKRR